MVKVIGVQFNSAVRIYDFKAGVSKPALGDWVLVETAQGKEIGRVAYLNKEVNPANEDDIKEILRVADEKDLERYKRMVDGGEEYFELFKKTALTSDLNMKPVRTELSFDGEKVVCYFTADARVDFRDLIRDLSREWKKGVMMRQIGPRDEAKLLDGFGICGQPICCKRFITGAESVTMDMAREQYENNVNASKVTGICGRLMCCLAYEVEGKGQRGKK